MCIRDRVAVLLTGVRLTPVRVAGSLTAMQVVLHEAFMWLGSPTACLMTGMNAPAGGHMGHGAQPMLDCATGMAHAGMGQASMFAATAMLGAHVAATAVMVTLLAYGEKVLWFLAGCVRPPRWLRVSPPELPAMRVVSVGAPRMLRVRFACGGVGRRGPPLRGLFAIAWTGDREAGLEPACLPARCAPMACSSKISPASSSRLPHAFLYGQGALKWTGCAEDSVIRLP